MQHKLHIRRDNNPHAEKKNNEYIQHLEHAQGKEIDAKTENWH